MVRQLFSVGGVRRSDAPRRALDSTDAPTLPAAAGTTPSAKPFGQPAGRAQWLSRAAVTVTVGALGVALAGSLSFGGGTVGTVPDTSTAVPAQVAGDAADIAAGRDGQTDTTNDHGTLDAFDHRQQSTSRDTVRKKLEQAQVSTRAQERRRQLDSSQRAAADSNREMSAQERTKALEKSRQAVERRAAEEKRKAAEAKRRAELALKVVAPLPEGSYRIGARWGAWGSWARYHTGQDLAAPYGTPIFAVKSGVVVTGAGGWAGIDVAIRHADGGATLYAHMSHRVVSVGQTVTAGQVIGYVGSTGRSFGPHLHFEYYPPGAKIGDVYTTRDPIAWLRANGGDI